MDNFLSSVIYWWHRIFLQPFGLTSHVKLHYNAEKQEHVNGVSLLDILKTKCPSLVGPRAWYTPSWWLFGSGNLQTAYQALGDFTTTFRIQYERKFIRVPDGGTICVDITPPLHKEPADTRPILVCLHGLTGGSHEAYIRTVLATLTKPVDKGGHGWRGIVFNYRGCAKSPLTSPKLYHAGASYDVKSAMLYVSSLFPNAPIYGIGFSLGANNLAKYLGVEASETPMKTGVVLGNPWNLLKGHIALQSSMMGLFYSQAMAKNLRTLVLRHKEMIATHPKIDMQAVLDNPNMTLYEFDSVVTCKGGGYESAEAYYRAESSDQYLPSVRVPLLSINALDDPIACASAIPYSAAATNPFLIFATTRHGGHLGWFSGMFSFLTKDRWVLKPVVEWLVAMHEADPEPRRNKGLAEGKGGKGKGVTVGEMTMHVSDENCGFMEVGDEEFVGGNDEGEESTLVQGL